jgi:hypothetical protein
MKNIHCVVNKTLDTVSKEWDTDFSASFAMSKKCLQIVEKSKVNNVDHFYLQFFDREKNIANANLYVS